MNAKLGGSTAAGLGTAVAAMSAATSLAESSYRNEKTVPRLAWRQSRLPSYHQYRFNRVARGPAATDGGIYIPNLAIGLGTGLNAAYPRHLPPPAGEPRFVVRGSLYQHGRCCHVRIFSIDWIDVCHHHDAMMIIITTMASC